MKVLKNIKRAALVLITLTFAFDIALADTISESNSVVEFDSPTPGNTDWSHPSPLERYFTSVTIFETTFEDYAGETITGYNINMLDARHKVGQRVLGGVEDHFGDPNIDPEHTYIQSVEDPIQGRYTLMTIDTTTGPRFEPLSNTIFSLATVSAGEVHISMDELQREHQLVIGNRDALSANLQQAENFRDEVLNPDSDYSVVSNLESCSATVSASTLSFIEDHFNNNNNPVDRIRFDVAEFEVLLEAVEASANAQGAMCLEVHGLV